MYDEGKDLISSPLANFQRNYKTWGGIHQSLIGKDIEAGIKDRLNDFVSLYESIKVEGYKNIAPFLVWFDDDGFIHLYDGHHRLSIIRYLGIDPEVGITTDWDSAGIDPTGIKGRDFPLAETASSIWGYNRLYHYVNDPLKRLGGFSIQRPDSTERRDYILKNLVGKKVCDIGCSEGFLSCEIAKDGYEVIGVEKGYIPSEEERGRKLTAIARYLAVLQSVKAKFILSDWKDIIRQQDVFYDNILYLSVLHNEMNALGYDKAMENLKLFRGKCKRLFVEIPDISVQPDWAYAFILSAFIPKLERNTGMEVKEVWEGYRPIVLLENKLLL
jgi:2-polyprenyl-3-methyl-5-hydroxy-6-metoxy-1,4-benzoquinol methylase